MKMNNVDFELAIKIEQICMISIRQNFIMIDLIGDIADELEKNKIISQQKFEEISKEKIEEFKKLTDEKNRILGIS